MVGAAYKEIVRVAEPGDVVFLVTDGGTNDAASAIRRLRRRWIGFARNDATQWHTTLYTGARKERKGATVRPYIIHSGRENGVDENHIPPTYFTNHYEDGTLVSRRRIELVKSSDLQEAERKAVVSYAREQHGKPFHHLGARDDVRTYAFGIRARKLDHDRMSCHGLIFDAYQHAAGYTFPHQLHHAPFFNPGRYLRHPMGDRPDAVDLRRLYLHDIHLYRDPRFHLALTVYQDDDGDIHVVENPGKYSWSPALQHAYGFRT
jgi:hypothetical protein